MSSPVVQAVSYAVNAMWEIPLMAGAGWVTARLARWLGPATEHKVWVATLMLSVVAPAVPGWHAGLGAAGFFGNGTTAIRLLGGNQFGSTGAATAGMLALPAWVIRLVFFVYVGAVGFGVSRLLWRLAGARALVRSSVPVRLDGDAKAVWETACSAFGSRGVAVRSSERVGGVVTLGVLRPMIVVPPGFAEQSTRGELLSAFGHELAHVARRDYAKNLFYEIASRAVGFHPAIWLVKARMVRTREMVCDALVVERLLEARVYRQSLLRLAERMLVSTRMKVSAVGIFDGKTLEERIMWMKRERPVRSKAVRRGVWGCMTLLLAGAACMGTMLARNVYALPGNDGGQKETVYHPGGDVTNPVLTFAPDPEYPKSAHVPAGTNKVCVVGLVVNAKGSPEEVHVVRSAGRDFDANAMHAVEQYRFKPATRQGEAVAVAIKIEVNFRKY